ncbi:hypothetical protein [Leucobacter luti]|uniref:DUF6414 family protein n=1 Tax=Leucobacter luti TaxID=340320 RepID=UPI001C690F65|nr:hypothetical protein [Leucobacter luti]QYM76921.1 hypothetical protein K1X41_05965 [Leucobacter luti]
MLKDFVYFDEGLVLKFAAQLDGGQRTRLTEKKSRRRRGGVTFGTKAAGAEGSRESGEDREVEFTDDPLAAFDRLLAAGSERPDELSWVDVNDPETDLAGVGRGFTIHGEVDFAVPPFSRVVGSKEQLQSLAQLSTLMAGLAPLMGNDTPVSQLDMERVEGVTKLADSMGGQISVIGAFNESAWSVAGPLSGEVDIEDLDGPLIFVGKILEVVPAGSHKSLMALPGMAVLTREQRRKMQQEPSEGQEDNWVSGPALVLKFLAIYR